MKLFKDALIKVSIPIRVVGPVCISVAATSASCFNSHKGSGTQWMNVRITKWQVVSIPIRVVGQLYFFDFFNSRIAHIVCFVKFWTLFSAR